jgi:hypothetical protein
MSSQLPELLTVEDEHGVTVAVFTSEPVMLDELRKLPHSRTRRLSAYACQPDRMDSGRQLYGADELDWMLCPEYDGKGLYDA